MDGMHSFRSNREAVRNPIAGDPDVAAIVAAMPPEARAALRDALKALSQKWRAKANHSWSRHKAPIASYHKANAVNARHLAIALNKVGKA